MKSFILVTMFLSAAVVHADAYTVTRILKDTTTIVALDLNAKTVFCTHRGYSSNQLKVSVPQLDELAHFDHRVEGETQPCMTAGFCSGAATPAAILDPQPSLVLAPIRVVLEETLSLDNDKKTCIRTLQEHVTSLLKGLVFRHDKSSEETTASFEACSLVSSI